MIIGQKRVEERLQKLGNIDIRPGVKKGIGLVQGAAKANCSGFRISSGELRQSIYTDTEFVEGGYRGVCYTDKTYASYVEFGTGPTGQKAHSGISPDVNVVYNQNGWVIPGNAMSLATAEAYGLGIAEKENGEIIGYYTNGQPAHPFMYPALKDNEKEVTVIITESIRRQI